MEKDIDEQINEFISLLTEKENSEERIKKFKSIIENLEKTKNPINYTKLHTLISKFQDDFLNLHLCELLGLALKFSDRHIYKLFLSVDNLDSFLLHPSDYFDSKNKISLFIIAKCMKLCSPKEIILFLNQHLTEILVIEKKFFVIEVYMKILDGIQKKELFLDEIFPLILMAFSSAIEKYIKNKQKLDQKPDSITNKDIIINFEKYSINLIRKILVLCKRFKELNDSSISNKILSINDICEFSYESAEINYKEVNPNLLLKHYLISFVMDIMDGVLNSLLSPFFEKPALNSFLEEILKYLFELHPNKIDFVNTFLQQNRFLALIRKKPDSIKENLKKYDKFYPYNCVAIAKILAILLKDANFGKIYSLKYQLKVLLPVIYENFKSADAKIELFFPLISYLRDILMNEKEINVYNLFNFENLNIFNVPLPEIVNQLFEQSGNYNCNQENQKILLDICNVLTELPNEKGKFQIIEEIIKKSNNSNLIAYLLNLMRKKIQNHLEIGSNDPLKIPIVHISRVQKLIENSAQKNKYSGISSKIDLINEIVNFLIYISLKFLNFQKNPSFIPVETHLMHATSKENYAVLTKEINLVEKEIKEELDSLNHKKNEFSNNSKLKQDEKNREIEGVEVKINHLLILLENMRKLNEIKL